MAADVYSVAPHTGRGGWSWYTGSAGWMYRLVVESLLGIRLVTSAEGARLVVAPCLPATWAHCTLQYRHRATLYEIEVLQQTGDGEHRELRLDGVLQATDALPLVDDRRLHRVQLTLRTSTQGAESPHRRAPTLARLDGETLN
jgi:cellobiose phosphorylase